MNWEFIARIAKRDSYEYSSDEARDYFARLIEFSRDKYCPARALKPLLFAEFFIRRFLDLDETEQQEILQTLQKRDERYKDF